MEEVMNFTVDPYWLIKFMIQRHYEEEYNGNDSISNAYRFALCDVVVMNSEHSITDEEVQKMADRYATLHNVEEISLDGDKEQREEFFNLALEIPRIKDIEFQYILKGYGCKNSVIDLNQKKEYPTEHGNHYPTICDIIDENYADKFDQLPREEQDKFVLENFKLIGAQNHPSWYTPTYRLH